MKFCPKCGSGLIAAAKFCGRCGATITAAEAVKNVAEDAPAQGGAGSESAVNAGDPEAAAGEAAATGPAPVSDGIACPQCGAMNAVGAKFCKVDGASLTGDRAAPPRPQPQIRSAASAMPHAAAGGGIGKYAPAFAGVAALIAVGGGAFYAYWTGMIGDRPQQIAAQIEEKLAAAGFADVEVALDRTWMATITGEVTGADGHAAVLTLLGAEKEVKGVSDTLTVKPSAAEIRVAVLSAINANEIDEGEVSVDENGVVSISGIVDSAQQRDGILTAARAIAGVTSVNDGTVKSAAWVTQDVNHALNLAGLGGVRATARHAAGPVTLTGEVASAADAARAAEVAKSAGPATIDNQIRVAAPVAVYNQAPVAATGQPSGAGNPNQLPPIYVGQWGNYGIANGPARYAVIMSIRPGSIGTDIGLAHYGTTGANGRNFTLSCVARLTLKSIENGVITVEETLTQRSIICPGNKIVELRHDGRAMQGEWRRKKDNSVAMTGSLMPGSWNVR